MKFDCVVSHHHNIHTCGVARFNRYLADHLGIPMVKISSSVGGSFVHPLVSIKATEMSPSSLQTLVEALSGTFTLILHDYTATDAENALIQHATAVMALNAQMASDMSGLRNDIVVGFSPGARPLADLRPKSYMRLITFGMAHKIQSVGYQKVGRLLSGDDRDYVLEISSALHEGTDFDDDFFNVGREISNCFGGKVDFLGFLADAEVSRRLVQADAMLAFFPKGVRENNNSVASAMAHGLPVITNLDDWSPNWMVHGKTVFDVNLLERFPTSEELKAVGQAGKVMTSSLDYSSLLARFAGD